MKPEISAYNDKMESVYREISYRLAFLISEELTNAENKIWHGHPVWFLEGNPIVGYSKQNNGLRLMFWSGADFEDDQLNIKGKKFRDASIFYNSVEEVDPNKLKEWLRKSIEIQWDYKNIVKRKGKLGRLK